MEPKMLLTTSVVYALTAVAGVRVAVSLPEGGLSFFVGLFSVLLVPAVACRLIWRLCGYRSPLHRGFNLDVPGVVWMATLLSGIGAWLVWGELANASDERTGWSWWMERDWYAIALLVAVSVYWKAWFYSKGYEAGVAYQPRGEFLDPNGTADRLPVHPNRQQREPEKFNLPL
jgi:hypothetical protein